MEFISFRSKDELLKAAKELAHLERRSKSDEFREIFAVGIAEKRKQVALDRYSKGQVSMGKAAQIADVSLWDFIELLQSRGVPLNLSSKEILSQVEGL